MAVAAADDDGILGHPFQHLRERVPEISMVELLELLVLGGHWSRPTSVKTARARSMCARVWVAIKVIRRRDVPSGTVGGRIPWAKTPRSKSCSEKRMHLAASPIISGKIGLALSPM